MEELTEEARQKYIASRWKEIAAPKRYIDAKIELTDQVFDDFLGAISDSRDVLIYGSIGIGKTYMSCAFYNVVINREIDQKVSECINRKEHIRLNNNYSGYRCFYTTEFDILEHRNRKFDKESISYLDYLYEVTYLTIDELGKFNNNEKNTAYIEEVISKRYNNSLETILITNLNIKDFKALYGDRLMDRLRGNNVHIIKKVGESLRGIKA
jgi:DNA replication protein DnaC